MYQQMSNNGTQLITFSCEVREFSFNTRKRYETCEAVSKIEIDYRSPEEQTINAVLRELS